MPTITLVFLGGKKKISEQIQYLEYCPIKPNQMTEHIRESMSE